MTPEFERWLWKHAEDTLCAAMDRHIARLGEALGRDAEPFRLLHEGLLIDVEDWTKQHYTGTGIGKLIMQFEREEEQARRDAAIARLEADTAKRARNNALRAHSFVFARRYRRIAANGKVKS